MWSVTIHSSDHGSLTNSGWTADAYIGSVPDLNSNYSSTAQKDYCALILTATLVIGKEEERFVCRAEDFDVKVLARA